MTPPVPPAAPVTLWRMPNGDYADPRRIAMPRGEAVDASCFMATEHRALPAADYAALLARLARVEEALTSVRGMDVDLVLLAAANAVSYASRGEPMPDATALGILARSLREVREEFANARAALKRDGEG